MGDKSRERLVGRPPGYLFIADETELDLLVYQRLVRDARKALSTGDKAAAVGGFEKALALWRGDAAEDLGRTVPLHRHLAALDEQRVTLTEDWIEARLDLDGHREVTAELKRLTEAHPLRERLWYQLMLAQYRVGGAAAALDVFAEARRTLVDQLGVEPGCDLARLHAAVLARDPALSSDRPAVDLSRSSHRPRPVARELPADPPMLVGRDRELATIRAAAASAESAVVAIHGPIGVGKSALALHSAHQLVERYPDGQLYVDLGGSATGRIAADPSVVLARFVCALDPEGEAPRDGCDAAARFRSLSAGRRLIIILDNVLDEGQVRPLLPGAASALVIITSRRILAALDSPIHIELHQISQDAAELLLERLCGNERAIAEPDQLQRIARLCERMPLALRIAGARLVARPDRPLSSLTAQLSDERCRLDALTFGDLAIRSSLAVSRQQLTAGSRLFPLLSAVRVPDFDVAIVSAVLDDSTVAAELALDDLVDARLLDQVRPRRYSMKDLVRLYANELGTADEMDDVLHRVISYYLRTARTAIALLRAGKPLPDETDQLPEEKREVRLPDATSAAGWLETERANMLAAARQAAHAAPPIATLVPLLASTLYQYLSTSEHRNDVSELAELSHQVAARLGDQLAEIVPHLCLAKAGHHEHKVAYAMAHMNHALRVCR